MKLVMTMIVAAPHALQKAVSAAALASLGAVSTASASEFEKTHDRFKNKTELWSPSLDKATNPPTGRLEATAFTNYPGLTPDAPPPSVVIAFRTISPKGWAYLKCHSVDALVDGRPFPLDAPKHSGSAVDGSIVIESIRVMVPWGDFVKIANASKVEFRVCRTELAVPAKRLAGWRDLVKAGTPTAAKAKS